MEDDSKKLEAVNIARTLHLLILEAYCPHAALRQSLVPEILLRCLFCLLEVDKQVAQMSISRTRAWRAVDSVLEHRAESYASGSTMAKFVAERFNAMAQFEMNVMRKPPALKE